jgi:hypothetical protein
LRCSSAAEDAARFFGTPSSSRCSDAAIRADNSPERRLHDQGRHDVEKGSGGARVTRRCRFIRPGSGYH